MQRRVKRIDLYSAQHIFNVNGVFQSFDESNEVMPLKMNFNGSVVEISHRNADKSKSFDIGIPISNIKGMTFHLGELDELHKEESKLKFPKK